MLYKCTLHSSDYFFSNTVFARLLLLNVILPLFLVDVAVIYQLLTSLVICGYLPSYLYLIRQHSILWKIPHSMVSHGKVISNIHLPLQTPPMETHRASVCLTLDSGTRILSNCDQSIGSERSNGSDVDEEQWRLD